MGSFKGGGGGVRDRLGLLMSDICERVSGRLLRRQKAQALLVSGVW